MSEPFIESYLIILRYVCAVCTFGPCRPGSPAVRRPLVIKVMSSTRGLAQDLNHVTAATIINNCDTARRRPQITPSAPSVYLRLLPAGP